MLYTLLVLLPLLAATTHARLRVVGRGETQRLDPAQFPEPRRPENALFTAMCGHCHSLVAPIVALRTGQLPKSGERFDRHGIKAHVVRMMRKANSGIAKDEARTIVGFLIYARELAEAP